MLFAENSINNKMVDQFSLFESDKNVMFDKRNESIRSITKSLQVVESSNKTPSPPGEMTHLGKILEEKKPAKKEQMDDVYDEKVYLDGHQLSTLKKGNILNYMALMELEGFSPQYKN